VFSRTYDFIKNKKDVRDASIEILKYLKEKNGSCDIFSDKLFDPMKMNDIVCSICLVRKECDSLSRSIRNRKASELYTKLVKPQLEFEF
jgi:hypothetical protein